MINKYGLYVIWYVYMTIRSLVMKRAKMDTTTCCHIKTYNRFKVLTRVTLVALTYWLTTPWISKSVAPVPVTNQSENKNAIYLKIPDHFDWLKQVCKL